MSDQDTSPQNPLTNLSDALANAVETAASATVTVYGRRRVPATGIVWSENGLIVTASHVIEREEDIQIGLPEGGNATATLIGRDHSRDLAVLRAQGGQSGALKAANRRSEPLRVGEIVLALGRPGENVQASFGIVNALGGGRHRRRRRADAISAELTLFPGFSGGPLIDASGAIAGMNTSGPFRRGSATIPAGQIDVITSELETHGRIRHAWLGVTLQPVELPAGVEGESGLLISGVTAESPAASAGLMVGDILTTLDGQPLAQAGDLQMLLTPDTIGTEVTVGLLRGGAQREQKVTPVERPEGAEPRHGRHGRHGG
jgi:S1-C subfamily serine protease